MNRGANMGDDDEFRGHPVTDVIRMGVAPVNWGINNENVPQSKQAITSASVKNTIGETLMGSGVTKLSIPTPTSGDPLRSSKSCILKRFSTPYIKPFRRHWSVSG